MEQEEHYEEDAYYQPKGRPGGFIPIAIGLAAAAWLGIALLSARRKAGENAIASLFRTIEMEEGITNLKKDIIEQIGKIKPAPETKGD